MKGVVVWQSMRPHWNAAGAGILAALVAGDATAQAFPHRASFASVRYLIPRRFIS